MAHRIIESTRYNLDNTNLGKFNKVVKFAQKHSLVGNKRYYGYNKPIKDCGIFFCHGYL